jgi:hypothetical protein
MAAQSTGNSVYRLEGIRIDVSEIKALLPMFGEIIPNLMRKALRRGFAAVGKQVKGLEQYHIRQNLGKRKFSKNWINKPGDLKNVLYKSLNVKIVADMLRGKAYMFCGPRRKAAGLPSKYAHFVEFGTKPHKIKVTKGHNAGKTFNHPGYKARPFIVPSYNAVRAYAQRMMLEAMESTIKETLGT